MRRGHDSSAIVGLILTLLLFVAGVLAMAIHEAHGQCVDSLEAKRQPRALGCFPRGQSPVWCDEADTTRWFDPECKRLLEEEL